MSFSDVTINRDNPEAESLGVSNKDVVEAAIAEMMAKAEAQGPPHLDLNDGADVTGEGGTTAAALPGDNTDNTGKGDDDATGDLPDPRANNIPQDDDQSQRVGLKPGDDANADADGADSQGGSNQEGAVGPTISGDASSGTLSDNATALDYAKLLKSVYGRELSEAEAVNLFRIANDLGNLTPAKAAELQRVLYGQPPAYDPAPPAPYNNGAPPAPVQSYGQTSQYQAPVDQRPAAFQNPAAPAPAAPTLSLPDEYSDDPELQRWIQQTNAQIAQSLTPLQQQIAQTQAFIQAQQQRELEAQQQAYIDTALAAANNWMESHTELTPEQRVLLNTRISDDMVGAYMQMGHDTTTAVNMAFDHLYWTDPEMRQQYIETQVHSQQEQLDEGIKRRKKLDALSGGGGAINRDGVPAAPPADPNARRNEMVEFMRNQTAQN